jgi:tetratricopeptide (TPR) repeat protein
MTLNQALGLLTILATIAATLWVYFLVLKKSDDPKIIMVKTVISVAVIVGFNLFVGRVLGGGDVGSAFIAVPAAAVGGLILAIMWRHHVINVFAQPFANLFTGGDDAPDLEPFYSIARAKRINQQYDEAIALIEEQLERFPDDFNGLMMIAEIQAVDQKNLSGAAETIELICESQMDRPQNVASALTALADWYLKVYRDRDAALGCFERIRNSFPKHKVAMEAAQRIAHMPSEEMLDESVERRRIVLVEQPKIGIRKPTDLVVEAARESPDAAIARLSGQLEMHPMDRTSREELATLYAEQMGDLPLAIEQLDFLLNLPQLGKQDKTKLLHRMTDLQVRFGDDLAAAEKPLDRIISSFPNSPMAEQASRRKMLLKKEFQGKEKNRDMHLGSYEKDLGLR